MTWYMVQFIQFLFAMFSIADKQVVENLTVKELTEVIEKESDETKEIVKEKEDDVIISSTSNDDDLNHIVENAIDIVAETNAEAIQEAVESAINPTSSSKDAVVDTQIETTVETTVEVKVIETQVEPSAAEPMDLVEETEQAPKSSWATVLGLQSIINVLSSPFKARRN